MKWWRTVSFVNRVAAGFLGVALAITIAGLICSPTVRTGSAWVPSLVCNLFTTGLTIYFVNSVFVRRAQDEHDEKLRGVALFVMRIVQPHVHGLLRTIVDPSLRLGPVGGDPQLWTDLARAVTNKMGTYQNVLDAALTESFERIRNCLELLGKEPIDVSDKIGALRVYMRLAPLVVHCEKIRRRFFPQGEEIHYGGMLPLLAEFQKQYDFPPLSTFD